MAQAKKFGAFSGVFTPSILTILGVIMYLRLPSIVGQAGLWATIGIIIVAHVISISTGLSVSSIATDKKVKAGGTYYMISRSLGLPIGGTLGLALFVGLSFSVSLYVIGFSESFLSYWGWTVSKDAIRITGSITLLAVTIVTLISTALALRMQFFIMAAIFLSLLSIFFGRHDFAPAAPLLESLPDAAPFIVLFGIFFPAVTGFEAGVSMSGDLQDPKKSIPKGTIWAIAVGLVVYIGLAFFFSYTVNAEQLTGNANVLLDIALFGPVVVAGIWGATISSALGSILGAPRILQATAVDRITPRFFARGHGKENEPRNALLLTFVIAEAGILIGELDVIARIVSMFFITTYGFLNLSSTIESWASPDFRPDFRIPKIISVVGATACFVVMIQLDFVAMIGATVLLGALFLYLKRKELTLESGDTWEGFWSSLVRAGLQRLTQSNVHERNWRPNIILFSGGTKARPHLITFSRWLVDKRGLLSNFDLLANPAATRLQPKAMQAIEEESEVEAGIFSRRLECADIYDAMEAIATYYGFSGVEPNTVVMGWASNSRAPRRFVEVLHTFSGLDLNILLVDYDEARGFGKHARVDMWWRGADTNIGLALALIRFLTTSDGWRQATVRVLIINEGDTALSDAIESRMDGILETYRLEATVKVINNVVDQKSVPEIISLESLEADLTLIGMPDVRPEAAEGYVAGINTITGALGTVLLLRASSFFHELSLGIETSAAVPVHDLVPLPEEEALPSLALPEDETFRWVVQHLNERLEAVTDHLATQPLSRLYGIQRVLIDTTAGMIARSFSSLHRNLDSEQRIRSRKAIQRVQGSLLFQAQRSFSAFQEEQLTVQREILDSALVRLRSQLRDLLRQTPDVVTITAAKSQAEGRFTGMRRLTARLRGQPFSYDVRFRDLVEAHLMEAYQRLLLTTLEAFGRASHETIGSLQKLLHNTADGLNRVERALQEPEDIGALVEEEDEKTRALVATMTEALSHGQAQAQRHFRVETRRLIQAIVDEAARPQARSLFRTSPAPTALANTTAEISERWVENQNLLLSRVSMGLLLLSFRQRMQTIVRRTKQELQLDLQNALIEPVKELHANLAAFAETTRTNPAARLKTTYDGAPPLDGHAVVETLAGYLNTATEELPETIRTLSEQAVQTLGEHPFGDVDVVSVSLRRVVDYVIETEFLGTLQDESRAWMAHTQQANAVAQDVLRLAVFHLGERGDEVDGGPLDGTPPSILEGGLERLAEEQARLEALVAEVEPFIEGRLQATFTQLTIYALTRSEGELQRYVRGHKSRLVRSRIRAGLQQARALFRDRLVRLLYQRSEGVLLARRLQETEATSDTLVGEGLQLLDAIAPREEVLRALPFYYRQLFLGTPALSKELWVGGEKERAQANASIESYRQGFHGGLMIVGEAGAGKTALSQHIAVTYFKREQIFYINPPEGGSIEVAELERRLRDVVDMQGDPEACFRQLPLGSVLILNDIERWWERSPRGFEVLDVILGWIDRYSDRCLFILNANLHAFRLIDKTWPLADRFLRVIACAPFNAEQLKEVILLRHRSTGLKVEVDGALEENLSDWKKAKLFTAFFDYARGNVGVALHSWICQIQKVMQDRIVLTPPEVPDVAVLDHLAPVQRVLLLHLILHGGVTVERLLRISGLEAAHLDRDVQVLKRAGLIEENAHGVLAVNVFLLPHLTQAFIERRML